VRAVGECLDGKGGALNWHPIVAARVAFAIVVRHVGIGVASALAMTLSGCPDASTPGAQVMTVGVECLNACVDDAPALRMVLHAESDHVVFPDGVTWILPPSALDSVLVEPLGTGDYCVTFGFEPPVALGETVEITGDFLGLYTDVLMSSAVFLEESPLLSGADFRSETVQTTACDSVPPCPPGPAPGFFVANDPAWGLVLEVFNNGGPGAGPLTLHELQWVTAQDTVAKSSLVWGDPVLESLPWVDPGSNLPAVLYAGQPPLIFDIPDSTLMNAVVVLVRAHSSASGIETRGVLQVLLEAPVGAKKASWGRLKDIFR